MSTASRQDVVRLFPGIQDHAVVEILAMHASVAELESAALLLADLDEGLIEVRQQAGERISGILRILNNAELAPEPDRD